MVGWRTVIKQRDKDKKWEGNAPNMPLRWSKQKWACIEASTSEVHHVPDQAKWAQRDYEKSQAPGFSAGSCSTRFHSLPFEFRVEWTLYWFSVWSVHGWNTSQGSQSAWRWIGRQGCAGWIKFDPLPHVGRIGLTHHTFSNSSFLSRAFHLDRCLCRFFFNIFFLAIFKQIMWARIIIKFTVLLWQGHLLHVSFSFIPTLFCFV